MPPFFEVNPQFRPPRPAANARIDTPWNCRRSSSPVWVWRCGHIRIAGVGTHVVQLRHWLCPCALAANRASSRLKRCGSSRKGAWPYDQYGSVERELIHDSGNVVSPFVAIGVLFGLRRCVRHAVTAQVERDDAKLVLQLTLVLFHPTKMILRPAMDQQDWDSCGTTTLANMQLHTTTARYSVYLHGRSSRMELTREDRGHRRAAESFGQSHSSTSTDANSVTARAGVPQRAGQSECRNQRPCRRFRWQPARPANRFRRRP